MDNATTSNALSTQVSATGISLAVSSYAFVTAVFYHLVYWLPFQVNVFEYAGLQDLVRMIIKPMGITIVGLLIGAFGTAYGTLKAAQSNGKHSTVRHNGGQKIWPFIAFIVVCVCISVILFLYGRPEGYIPFGILAMMFSGIPLTPVIMRFAPKLPMEVAAAVSVVFAAVPIWAITQAVVEGGYIYEGIRFQEIVFANNKTITELKLRYLGRTSQNLLLWNPVDSSVWVVPTSSAGIYSLVAATANHKKADALH